MQMLETKIPPVALFVVFIVAINQISHEFLSLRYDLPFKNIVFLVCFVVSGVVGLAGIYEFRRAKTTVHPVKVDLASAVVDSGIFAYSRNPMYLGLFLLIFGFAYWQQNLLSVAFSFGFVLYMNRFQILPEERALESLFGAEYKDYKQRVRRWI
ncbi:isoprenylcysteine carboxylmethyltransferase family protein [Vibrio sp. JPW-9-11-11]|uniref:methyltransferase family protein n=1 Tax=Vibrio sp. JPW-9-11-11 TaxID=1416532 RepID=UPI001594B5C2|nr:isoprenylcysteine carboxylmethyltransferase family protein [Vibrio sp. JPW-9-11-11]NVD06544.1 isoprenylcysteine carboxylmethyltransferase family protein [Vibrio sp. JPW-9-11-11]